MMSSCATRTTASEQLLNRLLDSLGEKVLVPLPHCLCLVAGADRSTRPTPRRLARPGKRSRTGRWLGACNPSAPQPPALRWAAGKTETSLLRSEPKGDDPSQT